MNKKAKTDNGLIISLLVIAAVIVAIVNPGNIIPFSVVDGGILNSYTCADDQVCLVTPVLDCSGLSETGQVVKFRTNVNDPNQWDQDSSWIALKDGDELKGYMFNSRQLSLSSGCSSRESLGQTQYGNNIFTWNSRLYICVNDVGLEYAPSTDSSIVLSKEPTGQYVELFEEGLIDLECTRDIEVDGKLVETITSSSEGLKEGFKRQLAGGQTIESPTTADSKGNLYIRLDEISDVLIEECTSGELIDSSSCTDEFTLVECGPDAPDLTTTNLDPEGTERCVDGAIEEIVVEETTDTTETTSADATSNTTIDVEDTADDTTDDTTSTDEETTDSSSTGSGASSTTTTSQTVTADDVPTDSTDDINYMPYIILIVLLLVIILANMNKSGRRRRRR